MHQPGGILQSRGKPVDVMLPFNSHLALAWAKEHQPRTWEVVVEPAFTLTLSKESPFLRPGRIRQGGTLPSFLVVLADVGWDLAHSCVRNNSNLRASSACSLISVGTILVMYETEARYGCLSKLGVLFEGVLVVRALLSGFQIRVPDSWNSQKYPADLNLQEDDVALRIEPCLPSGGQVGRRQGCS